MHWAFGFRYSLGIRHSRLVIVIEGERRLCRKARPVRRSGNAPTRGMIGSAVSPHPDPLPQGEGAARIAQWKAGGSGFFSTLRRVHPLPRGEGWGEGKEPAAPRNADALALAYGNARRAIWL